MSKQVIVYDRRPCSRCGGSGRFSFNLRDGDRCYGCGGHGKVRTRDAARSAEKIAALRELRCVVPIEALKVGDRVRDTFHSRGRYFTIAETSRDETTYVTPKRSAIRLSYGGGKGVVAPLGTKIELAPSPSVWAEVVELARTLPGVTVEVRD